MAIIRQSIITLATLLYILNSVATLPPPYYCSAECNCYFKTNNWITDCSDIKLTSIPMDELPPYLFELNMNGNLLKQIEPFPFGLNVRSLKLSRNFLTEIQRKTFDGLNTLHEIDLSYNAISHIDPFAFENAYTLFKVNLQGNPLGPVERSIFYSNTVFNLQLADCNLTTLSPLFFSNVRQLQTLDLSGNPLQEIKAKTFFALKVLKHLYLNNCNLTYIHDEAFKGLENLETLKLNGNMLKNNVDWALVLYPLTKLITLEMKHSAEPKFVANTFLRNTILKNVVLAENDLSNINMSTTYFGEKSFGLQFLDLSYCNLKEPLTLFGNATELNTLILTGNPLISSHIMIILRSLLNLMNLSLRDCGLSYLPNDTFGKMASLKQLDVAKNPWNADALTELLSSLEQLEHLDIGHSDLGIIPSSIFSKMSNLKSLVLSGNKIAYVEKNAFKSLKNLKVLEMNNCGLRQLSTGIFNNNFQFVDLVELRISRNPLLIPAFGPILPEKLSKLTELDMSECNLDYLPSDFFMTTPNIKKLILNDNELTTSYKNDMAFVEHLTKLEHLDLSNNNMTSITVDKFKHNNHLVSLKLVGNPWMCDCDLVDMWNWAASSKINIGLLDHHFTKTKVDGKKTDRLICNYDVKHSPEKEYMLQRPPILVYLEVPKTIRTWQRYLRNANCSTSAIGEL